VLNFTGSPIRPPLGTLKASRTEVVYESAIGAPIETVAKDPHLTKDQLEKT
jgi:hypothetical protein